MEQTVVAENGVERHEPRRKGNIIANTFDNGSIGYNLAEVQHFHPIDKPIQLH